jgi:hypothetical protein
VHRAPVDALRAISRAPTPQPTPWRDDLPDDQSFGALANRLLKQGLIERAAGRLGAIRHRLTAKGEATLRKGYAVTEEVLEASFAPLGRRQRDDLYRLLARTLVEGEPSQDVGL